MDVISIAVGLALAAGLYLAYLAATKGVPAASAAVKTWWTAGAAELATIKGDVAAAHTKIAAIEEKLTGIVAPVAALQTDVALLKTKVPA